MKRYWLFQYDNYYPRGGMNDFINSFDSIKDCEDAIEDNRHILGHIYDSLENTVVKSYY